MTATTRFDAAEYLDTVERQAAYVSAALETGDPDFVRDALGIVARARGMGKTLGGTGNPEFATVMRVLQALGLTLSARPAATKRTPKKCRARDHRVPGERWKNCRVGKAPQRRVPTRRHVIARSAATKQSRCAAAVLDCFASGSQ